MVFAVFVLTLLLLPLRPVGVQAESDAKVTLEVRGDRLTLLAKDAPLAVILERLAKSAEIVLSFNEPVEERVSVDLTEVGLEKGLQYLLQHRNTLFLYNKVVGAPSAVYVFGLSGGTIVRKEAPSAVPEPAGDDEVDSYQAELFKTAQKIETLEEDLRGAVVEVEFPGVSSALQGLLADPEPSVRITALHWLAGRPEAMIDAIGTALRDSDYLVQSVAVQIVLDHGVEDWAVEEVRDAAQVGDEATVRHMLSVLFGPVRS
jgi:hypothetical protein